MPCNTLNSSSVGEHCRSSMPDWRRRGKYAQRYRERLRIVRLADDVAPAFADEAAVNDALREYLRNHPAEHTGT